MNDFQMRRVLFAVAIGLMSILGTSVSAQNLDEVLGVRASTTVDGRKSQLKIDELTDQTRDLLTQFKQTMKKHLKKF